MDDTDEAAAHCRRDCLHRRVDLLEKHQQQQNAEDGENQECECKSYIQTHPIQTESTILVIVQVLLRCFRVRHVARLDGNLSFPRGRRHVLQSVSGLPGPPELLF